MNVDTPARKHAFSPGASEGSPVEKHGKASTEEHVHMDHDVAGTDAIANIEANGRNYMAQVREEQLVDAGYESDYSALGSDQGSYR